MLKELARQWAAWVFPAAIFIVLAVKHGPLYLIGLAWVAAAMYVHYRILRRRRASREQ